MSETTASVQPRCEAEDARSRAASIIVQGSLLLGELLSIAWMIERIVSGDWVEAACLGQFLLAMSAASLALYCAATRRRKLYEPMTQLEKILPEVRAGRAPLEDLNSVGGRLAPIAQNIHELFREIRAQKTMLADMDHEVRQRIANRTEALERKIGTLRHQATRDALTGLLNRRALDEHLEKTVAAAMQTGTPASVLMIDVDNFKPLNDTLGHAAGDDLLRAIGQLLRSTLRDSDAAFRCGGDEFVLVLGACEINGARNMADRLGSMIDGLVKTMKVVALPRLSIGAACLSEVNPRTAEALLIEADKRLYAVKGERKRGRSVPASSVSSPMNPPARKSA